MISKDSLVSTQYFRNTFSTPEGEVIFSDMLWDMVFFGEVREGGDTALHNQAIKWMSHMGVWPTNKDEARLFVKKLMELNFRGDFT